MTIHSDDQASILKLGFNFKGRFFSLFYDIRYGYYPLI